MKVFRIFALLLSLSTQVTAQDTSATFEFRIVDSTSASKSDLFSRAQVWIATYYHSAKSVIELSDRDGGKVIGKAVILRPIFTGYNNDICNESILYTLNIDVKDGKLRCILSDFIHGGATMADMKQLVAAHLIA